MTRTSAAQRATDGPVAIKSDRQRVELRGFAVRSDGEVVDLRVLDLSHDGCGIETDRRLNAGEEIKLSVLGRSGALKATVKWSDGRKSGLTFEVEPEAQYVPRRADRTNFSAEVFLRRAGKLGFRVKTFDLSPLGCKCEFVDRPLIEETVWVKFDGLEALESDVCWLEGSTLGIEFKNPLHSAVFAMLLQRHPGA